MANVSVFLVASLMPLLLAAYLYVGFQATWLPWPVETYFTSVLAFLACLYVSVSSAEAEFHTSNLLTTYTELLCPLGMARPNETGSRNLVAGS
jgi:hypothetical protein